MFASLAEPVAAAAVVAGVVTRVDVAARPGVPVCARVAATVAAGGSAGMVRQGGDGFEWDEGNSSHATRHGFTIEEIETARNDPFGHTASRAPAADEPPEAYLGTTSSGVILAIIDSMRGGLVRPISARKATRTERLEYTERQR